jgi:hypothetical protein
MNKLIDKRLVNRKSRLRNNLITPVNYAHAPSHFGMIQKYQSFSMIQVALVFGEI